jgi:uncharacterized surface protein with fasciclin (FAS1) repeats
LQLFFKLIFMKKYSQMRFTILFFASITLFAAACSNDSSDNTQAPIPNIAQIIAQSPDFTILNAAVVKTNNTALLSGPNLTLFAPDNSAFGVYGITDINSVPASTLDSILRYHLLGQQVPASAVPASDTLKSLLGRNIYGSNNVNGVFVNGISIKQKDVKGSNGYIQVINSVLIPPTLTIAQLAAADTNFSFLVAAVTKVGLAAALSGPGKYTVFAPTNAAFRAAGISDINALPLPTLDLIVKYHVLNTNVFSSDLINSATAVTLQGGTITVRTPSPYTGVKISGSAQPFSQIVKYNVTGTNGVIHVINLVMLP